MTHIFAFVQPCLQFIQMRIVVVCYSSVLVCARLLLASSRRNSYVIRLSLGCRHFTTKCMHYYFYNIWFRTSLGYFATNTCLITENIQKLLLIPYKFCDFQNYDNHFEKLHRSNLKIRKLNERILS